MRKIPRILSGLLVVLGLAGAQDDLNKWTVWVNAMDLQYWMTSGDWLPWGIRATLIFLITLLALSPEWHIRMKNKLRPEWPLDPSNRVALMYSVSWWLEGVGHWCRKWTSNVLKVRDKFDSFDQDWEREQTEKHLNRKGLK